MDSVLTTRLSSKGQVVIPESLRDRFGWGEGTSFIVMGRGGAIVMQPVKSPNVSRFDAMIDDARRQARAAGLTPADLSDVVARARARVHS